MPFGTFTFLPLAFLLFCFLFFGFLIFAFAILLFDFSTCFFDCFVHCVADTLYTTFPKPAPYPPITRVWPHKYVSCYGSSATDGNIRGPAAQAFPMGYGSSSGPAAQVFPVG